LFLKGDRCFSGKCGITRRATVPGQHGSMRRKPSQYGIQLREKQKAKRYYGVLEKQFKKYFAIASKRPGITGDNLLGLLESRLDNVAYKLGFGSSRAEARQLVLHGHVTVNGRKVNVCSYLVKPNDEIGLKKAEITGRIKDILESTKSRLIPKWIEFNREKNKAKILNVAQREDIDLPLEEHLIVELYSK